MPFVHLRTHTEYSVVDGTLRIDDAAAAAKADSQAALAITDLSNLFGAVKFYKACRGKGVKPIIGVDVYLEPDPAVSGSDKQASRLMLLAQDRTGYLNLCELLGRAWVQNAQRAQAWVKWEWLAERGAGLIALSGADLGVVGSALLGGDAARADQIRRLEETIGRQQAELDRTQAQGRRQGCDQPNFFQLFGGGGRSEQCGPINTRIQQIRGNLAQAQGDLQQLSRTRVTSVRNASDNSLRFQRRYQPRDGADG